MRFFLFMLRQFWTERRVYLFMILFVFLVLWFLLTYVDLELASRAVRQVVGGAAVSR